MFEQQNFFHDQLHEDDLVILNTLCGNPKELNEFEVQSPT